MESVGNGYQAKGFHLRPPGRCRGRNGNAYRVYLQSVFDELSQDLPGLFDRYSPKGRLFPRDSAHPGPPHQPSRNRTAWAEDETIGWIFQYFNLKKRGLNVGISRASN